jgi:hypothetical protein
MPEYNILYNSWKNYVLNDSILNEISKARAAQILGWISKSVPDSYSFDNLFGNKMRLVIPLKFEQKNIAYDNQKTFKELLTLVDYYSRWKYDNESLSRGNFYRINEPKDFGLELNLKRYKMEKPPPGKRVEKKIGKVLRGMDNSKNKIISSALKEVIEVWEREGDKIFCPQGSAIISRHPIDVARMSDFKNLESCHTPGSDFYKCAIRESMGNAPVAYFVSTKQLDKLFTEKGIEDISELDQGEILEDLDRNIQGLSPTSRLRLRKFSGFTNDDVGFELAIPEVRTYGNDVSHFRETINNWALNNQISELSTDAGDRALLRDKSWREEYMRAYYDYQLLEDEGDEQGMNEAEDKMTHIQERIFGLFPDMENSFGWGGGTYIDTTPKRLFLNFLGILETKYEKGRRGESGVTVGAHPMNIFSEDFIKYIAEEYDGMDAFESDERNINIVVHNKAREMEFKLYNFYEKSGISSMKDYSRPTEDTTEEDLLDYNQMSPRDFYRILRRGQGLGSLADIVGMTSSDILANINQYNEMISSLRQMSDRFTKFIVEIRSLESMVHNHQIDSVDEIIKMIQEDNYRFHLKIDGWMGDIFIESSRLPEIIGAAIDNRENDANKALEDGIKDIIELAAGHKDILQPANEFGSNVGVYSASSYVKLSDPGMTSKGFKFSWKLDKEWQPDGKDAEVSIIFFFKTHVDGDSESHQFLSAESIKRYEEIIAVLLKLERNWDKVNDQIIELFENEKEIETEGLTEGTGGKLGKKRSCRDKKRPPIKIKISRNIKT